MDDVSGMDLTLRGGGQGSLTEASRSAHTSVSDPSLKLDLPHQSSTTTLSQSIEEEDEEEYDITGSHGNQTQAATEHSVH